MSDELNYYKLDEFYTKCMNGSLDIRKQIQLKDISQTKIYNVSFLKHVLYLCKTNKTNLLDILNTLKDKIETFLKRLIDENFYIRLYIQTINNEWSLDLEANNIFNKIQNVFKYEDFINENKTYNQLIGGMNGLERNILKKEYSEDTDIRDTLTLLFTNCTDCKDKIKRHIDKLTKITYELEPTYNYVLVDLSMKHKPNYLEMVNEANKKNSIFNRLINTSSDRDIPENINMIFSNYLLVINLLKKEYHYLITTLKKLDSNIHEKHNSLNVLMNGLNIKNVQPVNIDSKIDIVESDDEERGFNLF